MAAPMREAMSRKLITNFTRKLRNSANGNIVRNFPARICYCSSTGGDHAKQSGIADPAPLFLNPNVQKLLQKVTGLDLDKIFRARPTAELEKPKYKLMTEAELQEAQEEAVRKGREYLHMPPVMAQRDSSAQVLSEDPKLEGYDTSKFIFTDITYGLPDGSRVVVTREPDGTLRHATSDERDRMLQIFYPVPGRMMKMPEMFRPEQLEVLLGEESYEYILDRACVQFEPDSSDYHRVVHRIYEHVAERQMYECLHSTRHFGGMVFYFVLHRNIEGLLVDMIQRDMLDDAADVIRILHIVHPNCKSASLANSSTDSLKLIEMYLELDSAHAGVVQLALQTFREAQEAQKQQQS